MKKGEGEKGIAGGGVAGSTDSETPTWNSLGSGSRAHPASLSRFGTYRVAVEVTLFLEMQTRDELTEMAN